MINVTRDQVAALWAGRRVVAWVMPIDVADTAKAERMETLLDASERERSYRLRFAPDRLAFSCAHALLRSMLSSVMPRPPWEWRFTADTFGRPQLAPAQASVPVCFSLTHTHGLAACALGFGHDVGIDGEGSAAVRLLDYAGDWLTDAERKALDAVAPQQRQDLAVRLWTLKEAAAKAIGRGLHQPFGELGFTLDPPRLVATPPDLAGDWHLAQMSPTPAHVVAVAVRRSRCSVIEIDIDVLTDVL